MNQPKNQEALARFLRIKNLCDGIRSSSEIAEISGENVKYIQKMMLRYDLPRRIQSAVPSHRNHFYSGGRSVNKDGYVSVICPHQYIEMANANGRILEHRLVMAQKISRNLHAHEVVDHIDGIKLHNHPDNLRLFDDNASHLRETIRGNIPRWSRRGKEALDLSRHRHEDYRRVDTHRMKVRSGDERLIQILRALLSLGKDSPYLLGSYRHLKRAGIVDYSRSNLELALDDLHRKYA